MLLYNRSLDVNHTVLRLSRILMEFDGKEVEMDRLKILDFILANPVHILNMKLEKKLSREKNAFKVFNNNYQIFSSNSLFMMMNPVQDMALFFLKENGTITLNEKNKRFKVDCKKMPKEIIQIINSEANSISMQAIDFIKKYFLDMVLIGDKGLKAASGLIGFKYDAI